MRLPHLSRLAFFLVLSLGDLYLTWRLVGGTEGVVYESNPLASWWLQAHGWWGLVSFKLALVLLVTSLALVITFLRPPLGKRFLTFACVTVGVVVLYSGSLVCWLRVEAGDAASTSLGEVHLRTARLEALRLRTWEYHHLLNQLGQDVIAKQRSLSEAVAALSAAERAQDPDWLAYLRVAYPGHSDEQCLAANLIDIAVVSRLPDRKQAESVKLQLVADFEARYGVPVPCHFSSLRCFQPEDPPPQWKPWGRRPPWGPDRGRERENDPFRRRPHDVG